MTDILSSLPPLTEDVETTTLPNGVRVVTENVTSVRSVSVGIWVATGARYEDSGHRGISHFLEHMLFKGTERRPSAKQISDEMDNVGGYLNAFTDKEYTCYYARALAEHLPLAIDILTDMYMHSLFDAEETARERKVVLEEIKRRDDDPEDLVHDLFAQTIFPNHPLGLPVIGTAEIVAGFVPDDLRAYMKQHYGPENIIVAASGSLEHARVVDGVAATLGTLDASGREPKPTAALQPRIAQERYVRPNEQVNFCVGTHGVSQHDDDKYPLAILDSVLGGSMGSRLFQEIREKRGLAYSVGSYAATHHEGGYFTAYGGTSPASFEECVDLVRTEFARVRQEGITDAELIRAKNQFRGSIIMSLESMSSRMNRIGKSQVYFDRVVPLTEVIAKIDAVTLDDIRRISEVIFPSDPAELTVAAVGPFDNPTAFAAEEFDTEALPEIAILGEEAEA
ncbi:MAG: pitrilysin family protein [Capsulimonadales bacterium]|nr:pitrilysin family protein [Capsulimonadales bacterium]